MNVQSLRREFPVMETLAYLNAGTCGPLPAATLRAAADSGLAAAEQGRSGAYYERLGRTADALRAAYAGVLGAREQDVALTTATSQGIATVLLGLDLRAGDEVLVADDEHVGLLGPLAALSRHVGITVRTAPLADLVEHVAPTTRLVACSHVSWATGALAPAGLADLDVPVLLDGAQGAGAVPVDVTALGCAFYAASGQKWLCGPVGTGMLWIAPDWQERLAVLTPSYPNLVVPYEPLATTPWPDARAWDTFAQSTEILVAALAAHDVLASPGWEAVHACAAELAGELAQRLADSGRAVAPRDATTLVSWEDPDPVASVGRLAAAGVVVRAVPGTSHLRASVGVWNDTSDLERLLAAL